MACSKVKKAAPYYLSYSLRSVLEHALIMAPDARDLEMVKRLDVVSGCLLKPC